MGLFGLNGRVAMVTGASRGLGKAMAIGLAEAGAKVAVTDVLGTNETVTEIRRRGKEAIGMKVDVSKKREAGRMVGEVVKKWGRLDILVNNAGIFRTAPAEKITEEEWEKVMAVNLKGQFLCAQEAGRQMSKQKSGRIINIASIAGQFGFANSAAYNASKAGIILLTKTLAVEWGKYGIRVNAICPGVFATAMTSDFLKDKSFKEMVKKRVPLGREGKAEELAGAVIFLASEASSYITGHALVVDGGWTAGL